MLPLAHSPVLRAKNPDEAMAGMRPRHPGLRAFHSSASADWRMDVNYVSLGSIGISAAEMSACDYISDPDGIVRAFVPDCPSVNLTLNGRVKSLATREIAIAPLTAGIRCSFGEAYRGLFILCGASDLADSLRALDDSCELAQAVDRLFRSADVDWRPFQDQLRLTIGLFDEGPALLLDQPAFRQAHEDLIRFHLANVLACAGRETARSQGHSRYTRRAVSYIEAQFAEPIGIETLARAAGCSVRTLQASMAADLGSTITGHIRAVRLARARALLMGSAPGSTVSGIALDCGFCHLGEFAKSYGSRFGERPSDTLAAARLSARRH